MPSYVYRCSMCGSEDEKVFSIGAQPKKQPCPCGAVRRQVLGVGLYIASAALPNKRHGVRAIDEREQRWEKDMPAYKDARTSGLQPRAIDGCAESLRGVEDQVDIDYRLAGKQDQKSKVLDTVEMLTGSPPVGAT